MQVALEKPCADTDENQGCQHADHRQRVAAKRKREQQIAGKHHGNTDGHHLSVAELVGQNTADERHEIDEAEERTVNGSRHTGLQTEVGTQEEREDGQHGVIAEPLAGIGERQRVQPFGLSFKHRADYFLVI